MKKPNTTVTNESTIHSVRLPRAYESKLAYICKNAPAYFPETLGDYTGLCDSAGIKLAIEYMYDCMVAYMADEKKKAERGNEDASTDTDNA